MVMVPQSLPKLKRFVTPLGLKNAAQTMVIRLIAAFVLHVARMSAVQAAGAIKTHPGHRAQVCRCLGRNSGTSTVPWRSCRRPCWRAKPNAGAGLCSSWTRPFTASKGRRRKHLRHGQPQTAPPPAAIFTGLLIGLRAAAVNGSGSRA